MKYINSRSLPEFLELCERQNGKTTAACLEALNRLTEIEGNARVGFVAVNRDMSQAARLLITEKLHDQGPSLGIEVITNNSSEIEFTFQGAKKTINFFLLKTLHLVRGMSFDDIIIDVHPASMFKCYSSETINECMDNLKNVLPTIKQ